MRKIFLITGVSLNLVFGLTGCLFSDAENTSSDLLPLKLGNYWEYVIELPLNRTDTIRSEVTAEYTIAHPSGAFTAYAISFVPEDTTEPNTEYYSNGPEGLYTVGHTSPLDTSLTRHLYLKAAAVVGQSYWAYDLPPRDSIREEHDFDITALTLTSRSERIQTPAGNFDCHVYHHVWSWYGDTADVYRYYAPGVGLVAVIETERNGANREYRTVLNTYGLK